MPESSFFARSVPFEQIDKLAISGGYSSIYATREPGVPVVGSWEQRFCRLADTFQPVLDRVHDFEVREDDVWIVTLPKCGTTWMQELTWLVLNRCDFETAKSVDLTIRSPFLEFNGVVPNVPHDTIEAANALSSPRLIKSHLPAWLLPRQIWTKKPKIIYVYRNPKDAAISYFHHWRGMVGYQGTKDDFMHSFIDGYVNFTPCWPHILDFWQLRHEPHIYFTSYERMKTQLGQVIEDVARFLQRPVSVDQVQQMKKHLSFESMRDNPACNHAKEFESMKAAAGREVEEFRFVRRGVVGSHKDEMTADVIREFDLWSDVNLRDYKLHMDDFATYSKYNEQAITKTLL
ncbi:sulfotransferase 1 family member D1 isoform X2 [Drosophila novamexicana]|uniref:sulfotransferase 1 family member D1 isoform X2 n=1 Tax=Drosophila novamexicana TaxID=47314 RepID=UPI0011E60286|nr:sulfotransferase 1 family member D1 isoform X2 [Drosophila novamexicana]